MDAYSQFLAAFSVTLVLLVAAFGTGWRGLRTAHLTCVGLTVVGLVVSVWFAIAVGQELTFDRGVQRIHNVFARSVVVLLVPMIATGVVILRSNGARPVHRRFAMALVATALAATGTGFWMKSTSQPVEGAGASDGAHRAADPAAP